MSWRDFSGSNRWLAAFVLLFLGLALVGTWQAYSPVPLGDMLDGYLDFYVNQLPQQGWRAFWLAHNEHRIPLPKLLFWLDLQFFHGRAIFLLLCNFLFAGLSLLLLLRALRQRLPEACQARQRLTLGLLLTLLLFSWMQKQNFTWGFQVQFFLAQLLPLAACLLLARAAQSGRVIWFWAACLAGVAAVGTMANGMLLPGLLLLLALLLRQPLWRCGVLLVLALLLPWLYFQGYSDGGGGSHLRQALTEHPGMFLQYATLYLGGPVFFMTGLGSDLLAELAGLLLIGFWLRSCWQQRHRPPPLQAALLAFLGYVIASVLMTAAARWTEGLDSARCSRYMTAALMAWSVAIVLLAPRLAAALAARPRREAWLLLIAVLLLPPQLSIYGDCPKVAGRQVAMLALSMGVADDDHVSFIYPYTFHALQLAQEPAMHRISAFNLEPYRSAVMGAGVPATTGSAACRGQVYGYLPVANDASHVYVLGQLLAADGSEPAWVGISDGQGRAVGYAVGGLHVLADFKAHGLPAGPGNFAGYVEIGARNQPLLFRGMDPACDWRQQLRPLVDAKKA